MKKYFSVLLATVLPLLSANAHAAATVTVDGSSSVFPITEAVAEDFQTAKKGAMRVTVGISGTGGGFKKFCRGEIDVSEASRPIMKEEIAKCKEAGIEYVELPVAYDALTVAVSASNTIAECVKVEDLKKIWEPGAQGKVTMWNQVRAEWPAEKLSLYGAGSDSGTFDYFTEAVVGKAKSSRGDYTASEDDNVLVQGIAGDKFALGYLPYAYYIGHTKTLKALGVDSGKGCVKPSPENAQNGTYSPLSRPLFIYVSAKAMDRPEVKEFVHFYLNNAATLAKEVHYLPLPDSAYKGALKRFEDKKLGTVFGGEGAVGITIEEVLKREAK